jgi:hypothetical protein
MQPRQSHPVTFASRYTTLALIHAGDAAARAEARRKGNGDGNIRVATATRSSSPVGNSPNVGKASDTASCGGKVTRSQAASARSFPIDRKLKPLPHEQGGKVTRSLAASATQLPHPAGEAKRTGGGRHHRTPITAAAMSGCGDSGRSAFAFGPVLSHRREEYVVSSSLARHCAGSICPVASPFLRLLAVISTSARMRRAFVVGSRISRPEPLPRNS